MPGTASKLSERLRAALVPLLWCLMHTVWLSALLRFVFGTAFVYPTGMQFPLWLVPLLLLGGAWLESAIGHLKYGWFVGAGVGLALVVGIMFLLPVPEGVTDLAARWRLIYRFVDGIPTLLLAGIATASLWAAGLAADWSDQQSLWRSFVTGIVVLAMLILLPASASGQSGQALGGTMALFLFCGLLLLALQALTGVLAVRHSEGARGVGLERYWLVSLGLVTLAIIVVGGLIGLLLTPDVVSQVAAVVWPIVRIIITPFLWVFQWLGYLLILLLSMLLRGLDLVGGEGAAQAPEPRVPTDLAQQVRDIERGAATAVRIPPNLGPIVLAVVIVASVLLAFYIVWRRRGRRRRSVPTLEDRTSIMSRDILAQQMREWLGSLRRRKTDVLYDQELNVSDPRQAVRLLYRRLLQSARRLGRPRAPGQTPESFGRTLASLVPSEREGVQQVTRRYVAVRYGDREPTPEQVAETRGAVDRVEKALEERGKP
ncbi:MAG: DUF4129 domain-containing protein [Anaerolineae bacterium]